MHIFFNVSQHFQLRVTNWNFSKWSRMVDVPGLCTRISNENTDNETVPDNSKPLVIEYSHSYKNFFVPKMPSNPYLDDKPVRSNHYERPVIIKKVNPKHSNIAPPLTGQYSSRKSNTAVSETSSTKSTSQHHEMDMSTLCSKFRSFNVESWTGTLHLDRILLFFRRIPLKNWVMRSLILYRPMFVYKVI